MTRHKSRVARIRRARRGTRKQSGGFSFPSLSLFNPLNWFKKTDPAAGAAGAPPTVPEDKKGILEFFNKANTPAADAVAAPAPDAVAAAPGQGGGRKTRHRRRSPRRHRK